MAQVLDHVPTIRECQQRLLLWGEALPSGPDGLGGRETRDAIVSFQAKHALEFGLTPSGVLDQRTVNALWREPPSQLHYLAKDIGLGILSFALTQVLKGMGINVDLSKISKAIAGLLSGAGIAAGTSAYTYISLPASVAAQLPSWVSVDIPIVNAVIGGIIGFAIVYFAPANKTN